MFWRKPLDSKNRRTGHQAYAPFLCGEGLFPLLCVADFYAEDGVLPLLAVVCADSLHYVCGTVCLLVEDVCHILRDSQGDSAATVTLVRESGSRTGTSATVIFNFGFFVLHFLRKSAQVFIPTREGASGDDFKALCSPLALEDCYRHSGSLQFQILRGFVFNKRY